MTGPINYYRHATQFMKPGKVDKLKMPILSIYGSGDNFVSQTSMDEVENLALNFKQKIIPGVSHWVQMDAPDQVNEAIEEHLSNLSK